MKVESWIIATEEIVANMSFNGDGLDEEMDLEEWVELLYDALVDRQYDEEAD